MVKKLNFIIISAFLTLLIISQITVSFFIEPENFAHFGTMHYMLIMFFLILFTMNQKISIKGIFVVLLIYQILLVFSLYSYFIVIYNNPLGFEPVDEELYHFLGKELKDKKLSTTLKYLKANQDLSDFGFPLLVKYIYSLGGNGIFNMKWMNISFHILTCFLLLKTSYLLFLEKSIAKNAVILYGLSPISIFFNASGFKEPFFTLIVVLCFYLLYRAFLEKKLKFLLLGILALLVTGTFRITFPIFIFLSFGYYLFISVSGKYKFFIRGLFLALCIIFGGGLLGIFQNEFISKIAVDLGAVVGDRLGRAPGYLDYIIMAVSGVIGPIPSFAYTNQEELNLLQTAGNFVKLVLSSFFLIGSYFVIKRRIKVLYPLLLFILANIIMLTFTSLSLLYRFHYPFTPFFYLLAAFGIHLYKEKKVKSILNYSYFLVAFILIIGYNLR